MDRLEDLVERGWRSPVGRKVLVDEEMLLNIIDQMRISIPKEIQEAAEVQAERDRVLARAQEEARRIILQARDEAERMLDEDAVRSWARAEAEAMLSAAYEQAAQVTVGADAYAEEQLRELERTVSELARVIQRGIETLAARRAEREAAEEAAARQAAARDEGSEVTADGDTAGDAGSPPSGVAIGA
ncbi:MAG TPA: ATP synthase F0 subunit B [Chloroflexi bacterium]|nr:ATP synthase F0 subunit B [Chloroflexota bacterium]